MDLDPAIVAALSPPQMHAEGPLGSPRFGVVAQVQDARLEVAQDRFHRVQL